MALPIATWPARTPEHSPLVPTAVSDLLERICGGFSSSQLVLAHAAEAAISLFVLGLYAVQRPLTGRLGLASALLYAYTFVFFTGSARRRP